MYMSVNVDWVSKPAAASRWIAFARLEVWIQRV